MTPWRVFAAACFLNIFIAQAVSRGLADIWYYGALSVGLFNDLRLQISLDASLFGRSGRVDFYVSWVEVSVLTIAYAWCAVDVYTTRDGPTRKVMMMMMMLIILAKVSVLPI